MIKSRIKEEQINALQSALRTARSNHERWFEMHEEYGSDAEAMEQWRNTARLRRLEVERIEAILAECEGE
jgi:hypothetical protein